MTIHNACGTNGAGAEEHVAGSLLTVAEEHRVWAKTSYGGYNGPDRPDFSKVASAQALAKAPVPALVG